jgi:hypothetical protein
MLGRRLPQLGAPPWSNLQVNNALVTVFVSRSLPLPSGMGLQFCFGADLGPMHAAGRMVADVTVTT